MGKVLSINNKIIYIKVDDAYAIWFNESKSFLMIEEPAFFILQLFLENTPQEIIAEKFSIRYENPLSEVKKFVSEITQNFSNFFIRKDEKEERNEFEQNGIDEINYFSDIIYTIGNLNIRIRYGDKELEDVIHPLISHHEAEAELAPDHFFHIYRNSKTLYFKVNDKIIENFKSNETGFLKGAVLLKLSGILHEINHTNWMMTIHAAAVSNGKIAILFPATAGSGKSTLGALLHTNGFNLVSDDFVAMDSHHKQIYQLPVSTTIKEGSFKVLLPYFSELDNLLLEKAYTGKHVRYLPINKSLELGVGLPVNKLVFVKFKKDKPFKFEKITKKTALPRLLKETWVNPQPRHVKEFFRWFDQAQVFEMQYSNISDAIKVVQELFDE